MSSYLPHEYSMSTLNSPLCSFPQGTFKIRKLCNHVLLLFLICRGGRGQSLRSWRLKIPLWKISLCQFVNTFITIRFSNMQYAHMIWMEIGPACYEEFTISGIWRQGSVIHCVIRLVIRNIAGNKVFYTTLTHFLDMR